MSLDKIFTGTDQDVWEGEADCEIGEPVYDGCYADGDRPCLL